MRDCIDCITSKNTCQMFLRKYSTSKIVKAGSRLSCCSVWSTFDVAEPEPAEATAARTDGCAVLAPAGVRFVFQNACWAVFECESTTLHEGYKRNLWDLCHVSTKWQYVQIMTSTTIVQFFVSKTPLESLQGSCSLIILKLLTSEKRFVGKKWKANGWLKGPGVCHHNAAGWSSPETWDQQKWKVEFFSPNIHLLKTKWCIRPLPDALDADMGKLPSRKSKIRSACCRRACDLSSHGKNPGFCAGSVSSWRRKNEPVEKISPQRKCPTLPCSHVPMETSYGFVS